jgi:pimeloyl-ACP methyl ester carboxylesterase
VLPDIEVPPLVVVGEEDALYSFEISMAMQEAIPTSELVIIRGAAHAAIIEAADEANQAILDWASGIE